MTALPSFDPGRLSRRTLLPLLSLPLTLAAQADRGLVHAALGPPRRRALLIGIDSYRGVKPLRNAGNDASDLSDALKVVGFQTTLVRDTDRASLTRTVETFCAGLRRGDTALFYYAGHGIQLDGENFLIPADFRADDDRAARAAACPASDCQTSLQRSGAGLTVLILDACRNNPFAAATRSLSGGLAPMETALGSIVVYSTGANQYAADESPNKRNGLFAYHFLKSMREAMPAVDLFRKVRDDVFSASGGKQRPYLQEDVIGQFYLAQARPGMGAEPPQSNDPLVLGQEQFHRGDFEAAVVLFEKARRARPEDAHAHNAAGEAYRAQRAYAPAVECYNEAIRLQPDYGAAYHNRALAYLAQPRYDRALQDLNWAIEQDSDIGPYYARRGRAHFGLRQYDEALADYSRALELFPDDPDAFHGRAKVLHRLRRYKESLADFAEAIRRRPAFWQAYEDRAETLSAVGRKAEAEADRAAALRLRK